MPYEVVALNRQQWTPGLRCCICGTTIHAWQNFNWDHEIPMSRGGRRGRANKSHAHVLCNSIKGNRWPFSLRTAEEREAIRAFVQPRTWRRLQRIWNGGEG